MNQDVELYLTDEKRYVELQQDIYESFGIPLVYNISDINSLGKRKTSFSKSINIPSTPNNDITFNYLFDIRSDSSFDMTVRHNCVLTVNKSTILSGYLVLNSIKKLKIGEQYQIIYMCNIYDDVKNLFVELGDKKLKDLTFYSGFTFMNNTYGIGNHIFNMNNVYGSSYYNYNYTNVWTYPLVDWGYRVGAGYNQLYFNKQYPYCGTSIGCVYPSLFVKAVVDKIFYENNFTYSSQFLNGVSYDGLFKKLITLYDGDNKMAEQEFCEYTSSSFQCTSYQQAVNVPITKNNTVIGTTTVASYELDNYYYSYGSPVQCFIVNPAPSGTMKFRFRGRALGDRGGYVAAGACSGDVTNEDCTKYIIKIYNNDGTELKETWTWYNYQVGGPAKGTSTTNGFNYDFTMETTGSTLERGDRIQFTVDRGNYLVEQGNPKECLPDDDWTLTIQGCACRMKELYVEEAWVSKTGTTISLGDYLPDMTQSEFLQNLFKLFNLYVYSDTNNPSNLIIEPRKDFYLSGGTIDWSNKVNYLEDIELETLNVKKDYNWKYKAGKDFYSSQYTSYWGGEFGSRTETVNNPLFSGNETVSLAFQSYQCTQAGTQQNYYTPKFLVPLLQEDLTQSFWEPKKAHQPAIGIVRYITTNLKYGGYMGGVYSANQNGFCPYICTVSPVDILGSNSYDINFKTEHQVYTVPYAGFSFTNADSWKRFWEKHYQNIISKNARTVKLKLNLTLNDIISLDFRNRILIDGQLYYIEKIEYDPTSKGKPSKVTLLKETSTLYDGTFGGGGMSTNGALLAIGGGDSSGDFYLLYTNDLGEEPLP